jgi:ABC-type sugar transport system ATPase subunit
MSIIYISHHLDEIFKIADSITVLKDGIDTGSMPTKDINKDNVIKLMIGRELDDLYPNSVMLIVNNTPVLKSEIYTVVTVFDIFLCTSRRGCWNYRFGRKWKNRNGKLILKMIKENQEP